jgi:hypothetical protein
VATLPARAEQHLFWDAFAHQGYEGSRGTPQGAAASAQYNAAIQRSTAQYAILDALERPNAAFANVIRCGL